MSERGPSSSIVTGHRGFLGQHLTRALGASGQKVFGLDRQEADVADAEGVRAFFVRAREEAGQRIDCVYHLAGEKSLSLARQEPALTLKTALLGTLNVLEAARLTGAARVVLISSAAVYREKTGARFEETDALRQDSVYAAGKVGGENLGLAYHGECGVPVAIARLANVYGPGQSREAVLGSLVAQMVGSGKVTLGNAAMKRDFLFVADAVNALTVLATHPSATGRAWNVGSGTAHSVEELFRLAASAAGFAGGFDVNAAMAAAPTTEITLAIENLRGLGWEPRVGLAEGIASVVSAERESKGARK